MRTKMRGGIERRFLNSCLTFVVEFLLPTAAFNAKPRHLSSRTIEKMSLRLNKRYDTFREKEGATMQKETTKKNPKLFTVNNKYKLMI